MQKGIILLMYHFNENRFEETNWYIISNICTSDISSQEEEFSVEN
jgi:hypothetical protein